MPNSGESSRFRSSRLPGVVGAGALVPLADGSRVEYANLDYAASAPCLTPVHAALDAALPLYSSVHRGAGYASKVTTEAYEGARDVVRRFAGISPDESVLFTRNTTDSMNLLAHCLPEGATVVVFESEHHASLLPWDRHCEVVRLPAPASPEAAVDEVCFALAAAGIGPKLLVVTAASNVTGELWPLAQLAEAAHEHGARIVADVAQLVAHRPLDMGALGLDYIAFSGHKLYAPFGAGVLAGRADWLSAAPPYLLGGGASKRVAGQDVTWARNAEERQEAGTPNVLGAITLAAACEALLDAGWPALAAEEEQLLGRLRRGLASIPGLHELSLWGADHERVGIVSFVLDGWESREVALTLSDRYGIGVRDGKFCAHPLLRHLIDDVIRDGPPPEAAVRASLGLGTTREHVDRLVTALGEIAVPRADAA
ncbi:aminotransferase class V-fold PLP-dependent enzyme [Amycolatopsis sp. H20-H5]|uniref:aminotransferase class V-fold PLP-dependent enzyme n=1 Tax=Amycolatopsis sp. H20-H5 TaxID=3046309 RepID=UPI002DBD8980|nr:aminotransferase class V-fold PLP-dependent enzyme [Amycolatopsis sp. H20-H5]MEC3976882.1 aminotransferase class V-fold PLP-dependent enzyme [Amycolatopsis sp. H20-H5]